MKQESEPLEFYEAELQEVDRKKAKLNRDMSWPEKVAFYGMLKMHCADTGKKVGWASHKYKEKTGVWPNDARLKKSGLVVPDEATRNWITSQNIAYAKRRTT